MSRIGKKPIAIPKGVTVKFEGNTVMVQGPKGKLDTPLPSGITMEQKDGNLVAIRPMTPMRPSMASPARWSITPSKA